MKPYVICHMLGSVDGRIKQNIWGLKDHHKYFEEPASKIKADAWLVGRKTMQEFCSKKKYQLEKPKEKIAKEVYENFYAQYQNNLFGNIAKRKQKHIEIWKNILSKQNITVLENESLEETENLKNQLLSEAIDETSALKTAIKIEELNLNDLYIVRKNSQKPSIREAANGIECGTKNHLFVYYRATTAHAIPASKKAVLTISHPYSVNGSKFFTDL